MPHVCGVYEICVDGAIWRLPEALNTALPGAAD